MKIGDIFEVIDSENNVKIEIQDEINSIIRRYNELGLIAWIYLKDNSIEVASIKINDKKKRKQGLGSALMTEITDLCDKYNLICTLTPEPTETPKSLLLRFYKKFGFVSNMGSKRDFRFRNTMIRQPNKNGNNSKKNT
jgi:N-acetylglutamate synthase-like GNAT family acetyltransferase